MNYAIIENGTPRQLGRREGVTGPDGTQYPANVVDLWTPEALASLGVYAITETDAPDSRWHDGVSDSLAVVNGVVTRQWAGVYNRANHVAAKKAESRNQYEIPRIDEATGDERAKLTLLALAVADIISRLAAENPVVFGPLQSHLGPWGAVLAVQAKGAEVAAAIEADPDVDLTEVWE
jgi:hypothetical protein